MKRRRPGSDVLLINPVEVEAVGTCGVLEGEPRLRVDGRISGLELSRMHAVCTSVLYTPCVKHITFVPPFLGTQQSKSFVPVNRDTANKQIEGLRRLQSTESVLLSPMTTEDDECNRHKITGEDKKGRNPQGSHGKGLTHNIGQRALERPVESWTEGRGARSLPSIFPARHKPVSSTWPIQASAACLEHRDYFSVSFGFY